MAVVWQSKVTGSMVKGLEDKDIEHLITELDDAVMRICQDFGIDE